MRVKPNKGRLVVRPFTDEEVTKSGVVVFRLNANEVAKRGEILAISEGAECEVGDTVMFAPFAGDAIRIEKDGKWEELRILRFDSILAILCSDDQ